MAWPESCGILHLPPDVSFCCVEAAGPDLRRAFGIEEVCPPRAAPRRRSRVASAPRRLASAWVKQLATYNNLPPPQFLFRSGGPRLDEHHVCSLLIGDERFQGRHTSFFKAREAAAEQALLRSRLPRPPLTLSDLLAGLRWWADVKPAWAVEEQQQEVAEAEAEWPGPPCRDPPRFGLPRLPELAGFRPLDLRTLSAMLPREFAPLPPEESEHVPLHDPRIDPNDPSVRGCHGYADVVKYVPGLLDAIRAPVPPPVAEASFPPTGLVTPQLVGYAGTTKVLPNGLADILKDPRSALDYLMRAKPNRAPPLSWRLYAWFWYGVCFRHTPAVQREALRRENRARKMAATVWSPRSNAKALQSYGGFGRAEAEAEEAEAEEEENEEEKENDLTRMAAEEEAPRCMALGRRELCPHGGGEKAILVGAISASARRLESDRWAALKLAKAERRSERSRAGRRELEPIGGRPESCPLGAGPLAVRAREAAGRERRARRLMSNSRLFDDHRPSIPVGRGELAPFGGGEKVWPQPQFYPTRVLQQQVRWADAWRLRAGADEADAPRLQRPDALDLRFPPSLPVELEWQLRFGAPRDGVDSGDLFVRLIGVSAAELEDLLPGMIARAAAGPPLPPPLEEPLEDVAEEEEGDLRSALRGLWRRRQISGSSCGAPSEEAEEEEGEPGDLVRRSSSDRRLRLRRPKIGAAVTENGRQLLLFRVGDSVFASEAHCPHLRAPLQDADIESLAEGDCVLRCARHRFAFNLSRGGRIVWPPHRSDLRLQTFPVRTDEAGHVYVAFPKTNPDLFHPEKRKGNIEYEECTK